MTLSFDCAKSDKNEALRGLPFTLATSFDWATARIVEDRRFAYPEPRFQASGFIGEKLHVLVFTPRGEVVHVISLRRANRRERARHASATQS